MTLTIWRIIRIMMHVFVVIHRYETQQWWNHTNDKPKKKTGGEQQRTRSIPDAEERGNCCRQWGSTAERRAWRPSGIGYEQIFLQTMVSVVQTWTVGTCVHPWWGIIFMCSALRRSAKEIHGTAVYVATKDVLFQTICVEWGLQNTKRDVMFGEWFLVDI